MGILQGKACIWTGEGGGSAGANELDTARCGNVVQAADVLRWPDTFRFTVGSGEIKCVRSGDDAPGWSWADKRRDVSISPAALVHT